ncbi:hypothetical protein GH714_021655 [Hevea brasiliensis]|uniref:Uncharacterized protein n=1 Tax=Hevea brasiliensis TaxID=3981 RepID=A0A6A6N654_HEVBR|nr:hypothetical protein GH714_021655 [Hevea brasiliensis]
MQSQNQKIQDLSAGLHRMEEMMSHRMEEMMSQMMELMKPSQGKGKEPVVPETQSNVNGTRVNPIEIGANSNEGRGILPLPKGKENGDSGNSSQGHKSSCNLRNSAMKLKRRRREREENAGLASGKIGGADNKHAHELKQEESQEGEQKAIMFEKFHSENPLLLNVCRTLFPDNHKYVWSGPRALVQREGSRRRSCIDAAIEILMK